MDDNHGDRMKGYEAALDARLDVHLPIYARIDGRSFSSFTRGMARPYDIRMSRAMIETTRGLVDKTHARIGYTQSDEISLLFLAENPESDTLFNGRVMKLTSILAALATALFNHHVARREDLAGYADKLPHFDCRVCQLPDRTEATNMLVWRWKDARKNAISMAAQAVYSPKQLHGKHGGDMLVMLKDKGVDFDAYPEFFRSGTFLRRRAVMRDLTPHELEKIPPRFRPSGPVERSETAEIPCPDFLGMPAIDREAFLFDGGASALVAV